MDLFVEIKQGKLIQWVVVPRKAGSGRLFGAEVKGDKRSEAVAKRLERKWKPLTE